LRRGRSEQRTPLLTWSLTPTQHTHAHTPHAHTLCVTHAHHTQCVSRKHAHHTHLGFSANFFGNGARHDGHVCLPCCVHLRKQPRQKLCWHGAWGWVGWGGA
jgi:hypothetical protein